MPSRKKIGYTAAGTGLVIFLVFLYWPSSVLDGEKGDPSRSATEVDLHDAYFETIIAAKNLHRPFPKMVTRDGNPDTPEKIALGRLLFFDPILYGDNTMSCAHCHHPDLGFTDNRGLSMGKNDSISTG